jgi:hypothetical protein
MARTHAALVLFFPLKVDTPMNSAAPISRLTRSARIVALLVAAVLLGAMLIASGGSSAAFADGGTASLSGTVTGSDAPGIGVAAVDVSITSVTGDYYDFTTTADDGTYSFSGIPADDYTLTFQPEQGVNYLLQQWQGKSIQDQATRVTITDGQVLTGFDAVLDPGATITGNVDGLDAPGVGVAGVDVQAESSDGTGTGDAQTDADGNYTIVGLPAGNYTVQFQPNDGSHIGQWWNNKTTYQDANWFAVPAAGAVSDIDAHLAVGATIGGTVDVAGSPNTPLAGVTVRASGDDGFAGGSAVTDDSGNYSITALPAGSYVIQFQAARHDNYGTQYWQDANSLATATHLTVSTAQTVTAVDAVLDPGASVHGTVFAPGKPKVPLANVAVEIFDAAGGGPVANTYTNDDGKYHFTQLAAGSYTIQFLPQQGDNAAWEWWGGSFIQTGAQSLTIAAGQSLTGISQQLIVGSTLSGTVLDSGDVPTPDGAVDVVLWRSDQLVGHNANPPVEAQTDEFGNYSFPNLGPGSYTVFFGAEGPGFRSEWWKNKKSQATANPVIVVENKPSAGINATLAPAIITPGTPRISGHAKVGFTLTAHPGGWKPGVIIFSYQWLRDGVEIPGGTSQTYLLTSDDLGAKLTVEVTGSIPAFESQGDTEVETSGPTKKVKAS